MQFVFLACRRKRGSSGINILSVSDSVKLKGCTIYKGNLAIEMRNAGGKCNNS